MADLGTIRLHQPRTWSRSTTPEFRARSGPFTRGTKLLTRNMNLQYRARSGILHASRTYTRQTAMPPIPYLVDYATYAVNLGGRPAIFSSGATQRDTWPWTTVAQPLNDAHGRIVHHPSTIRVIWNITPGLRSITIRARHACAAGPAPSIAMLANPGLGITQQAATLPTQINIDHTTVFQPTATANGRVIIELVHNSPIAGETTTWGLITTT